MERQGEGLPLHGQGWRPGTHPYLRINQSCQHRNLGLLASRARRPRKLKYQTILTTSVTLFPGINTSKADELQFKWLKIIVSMLHGRGRHTEPVLVTHLLCPGQDWGNLIYFCLFCRFKPCFE